MEKTTSYEGWIDHDVYDSDGDKIGSIDAIYYDDITGRPEWLAVRTGFFGMNTSFVPIAGATFYDDDLQVPYTKDTVKKAPNTDPHTLDTGALGPQPQGGAAPVRSLRVRLRRPQLRHLPEDRHRLQGPLDGAQRRCRDSCRPARPACAATSSPRHGGSTTPGRSPTGGGAALGG